MPYLPEMRPRFFPSVNLYPNVEYIAREIEVQYAKPLDQVICVIYGKKRDNGVEEIITHYVLERHHYDFYFKLTSKETDRILHAHIDCHFVLSGLKRQAFATTFEKDDIVAMAVGSLEDFFKTPTIILREFAVNSENHLDLCE